ncbi:hypothetical protein [Holospora curviuscula]|uniref:Uncharacterized protein n=1 Tax=Holospora curviuscula TaxID=1082868 RepID=A0A2S5RHW4_9PROT|nr:hypothetical protein [Holospora curviuscula]PPE06900.1 hypothetical protein HCUR_00051 [Holospora curviuscula]
MNKYIIFALVIISPMCFAPLEKNYAWFLNELDPKKQKDIEEKFNQWFSENPNTLNVLEVKKMDWGYSKIKLLMDNLAKVEPLFYSACNVKAIDPKFPRPVSACTQALAYHLCDKQNPESKSSPAHFKTCLALFDPFTDYVERHEEDIVKQLAKGKKYDFKKILYSQIKKHLMSKIGLGKDEKEKIKQAEKELKKVKIEEKQNNDKKSGNFFKKFF